MEVAGQWVTPGDLRDLSWKISKWLQTLVLKGVCDSEVCPQEKLEGDSCGQI